VNDNGYYYPTPEERKVIERTAVNAAYTALMQQKPKEMLATEMARICIQAVHETKNSINKAEKELMADKPDMMLMFSLSAMQVVCSAMFACISGLAPRELHAESMAGSQILSLVIAGKALNAMANLRENFDEDAAYHYEEEAKRILKADSAGVIEAGA
jgi:hypothetical protein